MNPSVNSTEDHHPTADATWPPTTTTERWGDHHHSGALAPGCFGLDSRPYHQVMSRPDWDWADTAPMIQLAHHHHHHPDAAAAAAEEDEGEADYKPHNIMQALDPQLAAAAGVRQQHYLNGQLFSTGVIPPIWGAGGVSGWPGGGGEEGLASGMGVPQGYANLLSSGNMAVGGRYGAGNNCSSSSSWYGGGEAEQRNLLGFLSMGDMAIRRGGGEAYNNVRADLGARLGLNLGRRTYFCAEEDNGFGRFGGLKRFRSGSSSHPAALIPAPLCQAEGCKADLSLAKHYHRRHKVCEFHSKAPTVLISAQTQRFCQQCSRFHALSEFDEGKRSCRKRLADHNRRRRKPQVQPNSSASGSPPAEPTAPKNENPKSAVRSIHSNGDQSEVQNGLDQHPTLLSAGQSAPSVPHTAQNEKKPSSVLSPTNEKEAYQQYLRGGRSSPGLSLSTLGGGAGGMGAPQQQSSSQVFESVDIPVPWLRSLSAKQNLIEAVAKPSISIPHIASDAGSPNRQFVELTTGGSSATMQALPHSLQNLLPLTASVRDHTGSSNSLVMKNMSLQSHEHLGKFSSPNLNLQAKAEEQEMLSLLDVREVRAAENQNQQRVQPPPLENFHHQLSTTMKLSESVDTQAAPVNGDVKFPGLQALRPFNHSIFNNRENIL